MKNEEGRPKRKCMATRGEYDQNGRDTMGRKSKK